VGFFITSQHAGEELGSLRGVNTLRAVGYMALLDRSIIDRSIIDRGITLEDVLSSQMLNGGPLPKPPSLAEIAAALQKPKVHCLYSRSTNGNNLRILDNVRVGRLDFMMEKNPCV